MKPAFSIIGPPGSGKGTQGKILAKRYGFKHVSVGAVSRKFILENDTPEAKEAWRLDLAGIPKPDGLIIKMLHDYIERETDNIIGFVLDTYPLSIGQAEDLTQLIEDGIFNDHRVLYLDVPPEETVRRILSRRICSECLHESYPGSSGYDKNKCDKCGGKLKRRDDDTEEAVKKRIEEYEVRMDQLKKFYEEKKKLVVVNGIGTISEVTERIEKVFDPIYLKPKV